MGEIIVETMPLSTSWVEKAFREQRDQITKAMGISVKGLSAEILENEMGYTTKMRTIYSDLLRSIMSTGVTELNERTGVNIKMVDPLSFSVDLENNRLPMPGNRRYYPHIAATEVAWQFMGTQDPDFIVARAPKLWSKFVENGKLKTAYGYRWRAHFGRDQLMLAVDELRNNPSNRQLYISAWDPSVDGLGEPNQPKNIPCPVGFTLSRSEDRLNLTMLLRSSDVMCGLPYDTMAYALTLDAIAASVGCRPGKLHITLAHPHIYEPHWRDADARTEMIVGETIPGRGENIANHEAFLPAWTIEMILADPDGYISTVKRLSMRANRHRWDPMPEIVE